MRRVLLLAVLAGCATEPVETYPASVYWMEWPIIAYAGTPVPVRLLGGLPVCRYDERLETTPSVVAKAVTFEPRMLGRSTRPCLQARIVVSTFDTVTMMAGLATGSYEMRAAVAWRLMVAQGGLPIETFGIMTVLAGIDPDSVISPSSVAAAGGLVVARRDSAGCLRIRPVGMAGTYVVENPPDSSSQWTAAVEGYIYEPAVGACGAQFVFHLTARK